MATYNQTSFEYVSVFLQCGSKKHVTVYFLIKHPSERIGPISGRVLVLFFLLLFTFLIKWHFIVFIK